MKRGDKPLDKANLINVDQGSKLPDSHLIILSVLQSEIESRGFMNFLRS